MSCRISKRRFASDSSSSVRMLKAQSGSAYCCVEEKYENDRSYLRVLDAHCTDVRNGAGARTAEAGAIQARHGGNESSQRGGAEGAAVQRQVRFRGRPAGA